MPYSRPPREGRRGSPGRDAARRVGVCRVGVLPSRRAAGYALARDARVSTVTFSLHVLKMGECDVAGPEVFWMGHWDEWVTLHFWMVVARAPGVTAIVNTGPPADLTELNAR